MVQILHVGTRVVASGFGVLVGVTLVSGCVYDAEAPRITYVNETEDAVVVAIRMPGVQGSTGRDVPPGEMRDVTVLECEGESELVVTAADGAIVGVVDGPICPGWMLTIGDDNELEFSER